MKTNHPLYQHRIYAGNLLQIRLGVNSGWLNISVEELEKTKKYGNCWVQITQYQPRIPRILTSVWFIRPLIAPIVLPIVRWWHVIEE